MTISKKYTE